VSVTIGGLAVQHDEGLGWESIFADALTPIDLVGNRSDVPEPPMDQLDL